MKAAVRNSVTLRTQRSAVFPQLPLHSASNYGCNRYRYLDSEISARVWLNTVAVLDWNRKPKTLATSSWLLLWIELATTTKFNRKTMPSLVRFLVLLNSWIKSYTRIFHGVTSIISVSFDKGLAGLWNNMFGVYIISGNMGTNLISELKQVRHWSCLSPTLTALELSSSRMWYPTFLSLRRWFPCFFCFFFKCWVMFSQTEKRPSIFFLVMLLIMPCKKALTFNCSEWTCKIIVTSHHLSRLFDSH